MNYLKILATLAAVVLTAFTADAASATTTICTTTATPCPAGWRVDASEDSHVQANITEAALWATSEETDEPRIACGKGSLTATMESNTTAQLNSLTFAECATDTLTASGATLGKLHISNRAGTHNGTVSLTNTVLKMVIGHVQTCFYGVKGASTLDIGEVETTKLNVSAVVGLIDDATHNSSFFCAGTVNWETSGHFETPNQIFVVTD